MSFVRFFTGDFPRLRFRRDRAFFGFKGPVDAGRPGFFFFEISFSILEVQYAPTDDVLQNWISMSVSPSVGNDVRHAATLRHQRRRGQNLELG